MKGTLHKTESGWQVWYHAKEDLFYGNTGVRILPLLQEDAAGLFIQDTDSKYEGQEVEFRVIEFPVPPTNGPVSNSINKYAQLIDKAFVPMKGGESWNKILDKAIQDKAETFTDGHYHYRGKDSFIEGYKQGQEDTKGMRYTEENMRELYAYAKTPDVVFYKKDGSKELHTTNLEDYLQALNKQDNEWITMKEGDITVNFKPMPEFDDPKYTGVMIVCPRCKDIMPCACNTPGQTSLLNSIRSNASWDSILKEFISVNSQTKPLTFECWLIENYNPPTKKQDNEK